MSARILVVDDLAANLRLLKVRLSAEYYEVATATSGPEALERARDWSPDVVLLDVMMPGMDGFEVCRRLKADPRTRHLPVIMLTALTDRDERVRGLEAGADDFLSKPVDQPTLFARLRALMRTKQVFDAFRTRVSTAHELGLIAPPGPERAVAGARALVAGWDAAGVADLAAMLADEGIDVETMTDPDAGLSTLQVPRWELVVIDFPADGTDGLRLATRLRARGAMRDLPILLVADPDQMEQVQRGLDLGANDHTVRPVHPAELRARARNQIRRHRYQDALRQDMHRSLELAVTDSLTGLRNRRYAEHHLRALLRDGGAAVLMVDLDHFKDVNDIRPATRFCATSPNVFGKTCAPWTSWPATAARSS